MLRGAIFNTYHSTKVKTKIHRVLNRARIKLEKAPILKINSKSRRNFYNRTYFGRFVIRKGRRFRKTLRYPPGRSLLYQTEGKHFYYKLSSRRSRKRIYKSFKSRSRMHFIRPFTFGLVTAINRKRNFYAAVHAIDPSKTLPTRLSFKSSVGLTGFIGPKRGTYMGKNRVGVAIARHLRKVKFSLLDIVFPRRLSKRFRFFMRGLLTKRFWVRRIHISKRRSHGYTRLRKPKRK
jgi:hypothetical protein